MASEKQVTRIVQITQFPVTQRWCPTKFPTTVLNDATKLDESAVEISLQELKENLIQTEMMNLSDLVEDVDVQMEIQFDYFPFFNKKLKNGRKLIFPINEEFYQVATKKIFVKHHRVHGNEGYATVQINENVSFEENFPADEWNYNRRSSRVYTEISPAPYQPVTKKILKIYSMDDDDEEKFPFLQDEKQNYKNFPMVIEKTPKQVLHNDTLQKILAAHRIEKDINIFKSATQKGYPHWFPNKFPLENMQLEYKNKLIFPIPAYDYVPHAAEELLERKPKIFHFPISEEAAMDLVEFPFFGISKNQPSPSIEQKLQMLCISYLSMRKFKNDHKIYKLAHDYATRTQADLFSQPLQYFPLERVPIFNSTTKFPLESLEVIIVGNKKPQTIIKNRSFETELPHEKSHRLLGNFESVFCSASTSMPSLHDDLVKVFFKNPNSKMNSTNFSLKSNKLVKEASGVQEKTKGNNKKSSKMVTFQEDLLEPNPMLATKLKATATEEMLEDIKSIKKPAADKPKLTNIPDQHSQEISQDNQLVMFHLIEETADRLYKNSPTPKEQASRAKKGVKFHLNDLETDRANSESKQGNSIKQADSINYSNRTEGDQLYYRSLAKKVPYSESKKGKFKIGDALPLIIIEDKSTLYFPSAPDIYDIDSSKFPICNIKTDKSADPVLKVMQAALRTEYEFLYFIKSAIQFEEKFKKEKEGILVMTYKKFPFKVSFEAAKFPFASMCDEIVVKPNVLQRFPNLAVFESENLTNFPTFIYRASKISPKHSLVTIKSTYLDLHKIVVKYQKKFKQTQSELFSMTLHKFPFEKLPEQRNKFPLTTFSFESLEDSTSVFRKTSGESFKVPSFDSLEDSYDHLALFLIPADNMLRQKLVRELSFVDINKSLPPIVPLNQDAEAVPLRNFPKVPTPFILDKSSDNSALLLVPSDKMLRQKLVRELSFVDINKSLPPIVPLNQDAEVVPLKIFPKVPTSFILETSSDNPALLLAPPENMLRQKLVRELSFVDINKSLPPIVPLNQDADAVSFKNFPNPKQLAPSSASISSPYAATSNEVVDLQLKKNSVAALFCREIKGNFMPQINVKIYASHFQNSQIFLFALNSFAPNVENIALTRPKNNFLDLQDPIQVCKNENQTMRRPTTDGVKTYESFPFERVQLKVDKFPNENKENSPKKPDAASEVNFIVKVKDNIENTHKDTRKNFDFKSVEFLTEESATQYNCEDSEKYNLNKESILKNLENSSKTNGYNLENSSFATSCSTRETTERASCNVSRDPMFPITVCKLANTLNSASESKINASNEVNFQMDSNSSAGACSATLTNNSPINLSFEANTNSPIAPCFNNNSAISLSSDANTNFPTTSLTTPENSSPADLCSSMTTNSSLVSIAITTNSQLTSCSESTISSISTTLKSFLSSLLSNQLTESKGDNLLDTGASPDERIICSPESSRTSTELKTVQSKEPAVCEYIGSRELTPMELESVTTLCKNSPQNNKISISTSAIFPENQNHFPAASSSVFSLQFPCAKFSKTKTSSQSNSLVRLADQQLFGLETKTPIFSYQPTIMATFLPPAINKSLRNNKRKYFPCQNECQLKNQKTFPNAKMDLSNKKMDKKLNKKHKIIIRKYLKRKIAKNNKKMSIDDTINDKAKNNKSKENHRNSNSIEGKYENYKIYTNSNINTKNLTQEEIQVHHLHNDHCAQVQQSSHDSKNVLSDMPHKEHFIPTAVQSNHYDHDFDDNDDVDCVSQPLTDSRHLNDDAILKRTDAKNTTQLISIEQYEDDKEHECCRNINDHHIQQQQQQHQQTPPKSGNLIENTIYYMLTTDRSDDSGYDCDPHQQLYLADSNSRDLSSQPEVVPFSVSTRSRSIACRTSETETVPYVRVYLCCCFCCNLKQVSPGNDHRPLLSSLPKLFALEHVESNESNCAEVKTNLISKYTNHCCPYLEIEPYEEFVIQNEDFNEMTLSEFEEVEDSESVDNKSEENCEIMKYDDIKSGAKAKTAAVAPMLSTQLMNERNTRTPVSYNRRKATGITDLQRLESGYSDKAHKEHMQKYVTSRANEPVQRTSLDVRSAVPSAMLSTRDQRYTAQAQRTPLDVRSAVSNVTSRSHEPAHRTPLDVTRSASNVTTTVGSRSTPADSPRTSSISSIASSAMHSRSDYKPVADAILPDRTVLRRQRRLLTREEQKEDPIERLNRLRARISASLSEVKGVLTKYSVDEGECEGAAQQSVETKSSLAGFRIVDNEKRESTAAEKDIVEKRPASKEQSTAECTTQATKDEIPTRSSENAESMLEPTKQNLEPLSELTKKDDDTESTAELSNQNEATESEHETGPVFFRFVKKIRRRSTFDEDAENEMKLLQERDEADRSSTNEKFIGDADLLQNQAVKSTNAENATESEVGDKALSEASTVSESLQVSADETRKYSSAIVSKEQEIVPPIDNQKLSVALLQSDEEKLLKMAKITEQAKLESDAAPVDLQTVIQITDKEIPSITVAPKLKIENEDEPFIATPSSTPAPITTETSPPQKPKSHLIAKTKSSTTAVNRRASIAAVETSQIELPTPKLNERRPSDSQTVLKRKVKSAKPTTSGIIGNKNATSNASSTALVIDEVVVAKATISQHTPEVEAIKRFNDAAAVNCKPTTTSSTANCSAIGTLPAAAVGVIKDSGAAATTVASSIAASTVTAKSSTATSKNSHKDAVIVVVVPPSATTAKQPVKTTTQLPTQLTIDSGSIDASLNESLSASRLDEQKQQHQTKSSIVTVVSPLRASEQHSQTDGNKQLNEQLKKQETVIQSVIQNKNECLRSEKKSENLQELIEHKDFKDNKDFQAQELKQNITVQQVNQIQNQAITAASVNQQVDSLAQPPTKEFEISTTTAAAEAAATEKSAQHKTYAPTTNATSIEDLKSCQGTNDSTAVQSLENKMPELKVSTGPKQAVSVPNDEFAKKKFTIKKIVRKSSVDKPAANNKQKSKKAVEIENDITSETITELPTESATEIEPEPEPEPIVIAPPKPPRKIRKKVIIKRQQRRLSVSDSFFAQPQTPADDEDVETVEKAIEYVTDDEADQQAEEEALLAEPPKPLKTCIRQREYQIGDQVLYAERYKKTMVRWKRGVVVDRITSISYTLNIDGKEVPAHISYIKRYSDRKVNFGGKTYLEIDYEQIAEEERKARTYSIWNMV